MHATFEPNELCFGPLREDTHKDVYLFRATIWDNQKEKSIDAIFAVTCEYLKQNSSGEQDIQRLASNWYTQKKAEITKQFNEGRVFLDKQVLCNAVRSVRLTWEDLGRAL